MPKEEIPDLLHAADLGLHVLADVELFRDGVSPNKVFDYMAAGLPVLTNCPGLVSDLVEEAAAGWWVEPRALESGFKEASMDQGGSAGENGRTWIEAHQSRTAMALRLAAVLTSPNGTA